MNALALQIPCLICPFIEKNNNIKKKKKKKKKNYIIASLGFELPITLQRIKITANKIHLLC